MLKDVAKKDSFDIEISSISRGNLFPFKFEEKNSNV